eukprot:TRINITY_DN34714_c0_g1_i1.p2 TRINITY_DN34714_c0_g1~~TRINITY_DN34714_c0_g1_i1.p2  ORF type:complete len:71 (+),score=3.82 TRINITY_DN34714_c0_g1_i1:282-494(+)
MQEINYKMNTMEKHMTILKKKTLYSQKYFCRNISRKSFQTENTYGMKLRKSKKVKIHNLQEICSLHFQEN